jgi:hypothetical protein
MTIRSRLLKAHPATLVLASFLIAITVGMFLLKLPISTRAGHIEWVDAIFTATSAVCVTGLIVVDTGTYFTGFGQAVILLLIQIGGLGVMTFSVALFRLIGRSVSFRQRLAIAGSLFSHAPEGYIQSHKKHDTVYSRCGVNRSVSSLCSLEPGAFLFRGPLHIRIPFYFRLLQRRLFPLFRQHDAVQRQPSSQRNHVLIDCGGRDRFSSSL